MKLLTKALETRFARVGRQENVEDPVVIAKYFHPFSSTRHYATEYDATDRLFFGWVAGPFPELGYFSLDELERTRFMGLPMERDLYFPECKLSAVKSGEVL